MYKSYQIVEGAREKLDNKIKILNRKIIRNNLSIMPISYVIEGVSFIENNDGGIVRALDITLSYDIIKIHGYSVIAQLNHEYENGNIVRMIDTTKEIDKKYFDIDCNCEHCGIKRVRKTTYIIEDNEGNSKQIGKTCLNNYIGIDVNNYVSYLEWIENIDDVVDGLNRSGSSSDKFYINTLNYLGVVDEVINKFGYVSKSKAMDLSYENQRRVDSTSEISHRIYVNIMCHRFLFDGYYSEIYNIFKDGLKFSETVINAIEWVKSIDISDNEYLNNLKVLVRNEYIQEKDLGYMASLLATYFKAMEREEDNKHQKIASKFIGEVGDKTILTVVVDRIINYDTQYGTIHIHLMHDENENIIVYKGTKFLLDNINDVGAEITFKCTIKEHTEYDGKKQTIVQRPKLI